MFFEEDFFKSVNLNESGKLEKARPTKYISKKKVKGKWEYKYKEDVGKKNKKEKPEGKFKINDFKVGAKLTWEESALIPDYERTEKLNRHGTVDRIEGEKNIFKRC